MDKRSSEYRKIILEIVRRQGRGHVGSAFSVMEILRILYENILKVNPKDPFWADRDRFILSKGHGCLALYVVLAKAGFFPEEKLYHFCEPDSFLGGHPDFGKVPGVEASTGSLGHGLSLGIGMALAAKLDKKNYRTFILVGDGECNEGSVWEAAMCASKHKLNRLVVLIDSNKMQCYSTTKEVQDLEPLADKWKSFGFNVKEVDGHNLESLQKIFKGLKLDGHKPTAIICHTVKGKGVKSIEGNPEWHHKSSIHENEIKELFAELG